MSRILFLSLAGALLLVTTDVQAQDGATLRGVVTEAQSGNPIPGANVSIPELQKGAATGVDGTYEVTGIPEGTYRVRVRFVGFRTVTETIDIAEGATITRDFELSEDLLELNEVVVTGQGSGVEKRQLASNVDVITASDIEDVPATSIDQLLQGRVTGSTIRAQSAQPGQGNLINLRGVKSLFSDQTPVIYVDGVRVDNSSETSFSLGGETTSALAEILTSDIERIEVTKGGAASTLYGSDAANGVIQIFTKSGQTGEPEVTFRTEQGANFPVSRFFLDTGFSFPSTNPASEDYNPDSPNAGLTNFIEDEFLKTGYFQNYYVGISGGTEQVQYNVSGRVQDQGGVQPKNSSTLYSLRGSMQSSLSEDLSVKFSAAYTRSNFSRINNGTAIADPLTALEVGDALFFTGTSTLPDALDIFLLSEAKEGVDRFTFSSNATYAPSDLFSSSITIGLDNRVNEQRILNPRGADILTGLDNGGLTRFNRDFQSVTLEYRGTIAYPREGNVTSNFTFGLQGFREESSTVFADAETLTPGTSDVGAAGNVTADEIREQIFNGGIFFKEQVGLYDRLFINAGLRLDGNSAFGDDVGLQPYPSLGAAYTLSDEAFWKESLGNLIPEMKLRAAFGQTGKFPGPFDRDFSFTAVSFRGTPAPRFDNPGDENLKPEVTSTLEGGFESSILNSRLGLNFTYYYSQTNDALVFVPEEPVTGQFSQLRNVGTIENQGIELAADARLIRSEALFWSVGASWSWNKNEVTKLDNLLPFNEADIQGIAQQRVEEGRPIGAWRATTPTDTDGDGLLDSVTLTYPGSTPYPVHTGSINTSVTFLDNFNLFALADWATGAEVLDLSSHWAEFNGLERVPRPEQFQTQEEAEAAGNAEPQSEGDFRTTEAGTFLLQDGDFLKIREVSLSYNVPSNLLTRFGAQGGSVSVTMRNVWEFTRTKFLDPELAGVNDGAAGVGNAGLQLGGVQSATLSAPRQLRVALQLKF